MKYNSIMHIAFFTEHLDEMIDFYTNKMGGKVKSIARWGMYLNNPNRPQFQEAARNNPDGIVNCYIELAPGQFIELFPAYPTQLPHPKHNHHIGYSHFALLVDDIFETRKELEARGVVFTSEISKGATETYQMWTHDPDDNYFEIMQYTENSIQLKGNV